jgi:hypothetical protein
MAEWMVEGRGLKVSRVSRGGSRTAPTAESYDESYRYDPTGTPHPVHQRFEKRPSVLDGCPVVQLFIYSVVMLVLFRVGAIVKYKRAFTPI